MVEISLNESNVVFEIKGWDKLWSFRSSLSIPAKHIVAVHPYTSDGMGWFSGLKLIGTAIPNLFKAGTFYQEGETVFWDVRKPENAIVIELVHEQFKKLIIEVENIYDAISLLTGKIGNS